MSLKDYICICCTQAVNLIGATKYYWLFSTSRISDIKEAHPSLDIMLFFSWFACAMKKEEKNFVRSVKETIHLSFCFYMDSPMSLRRPHQKQGKD